MSREYTCVFGKVGKKNHGNQNLTRAINQCEILHFQLSLFYKQIALNVRLENAFFSKSLLLSKLVININIKNFY